MIHVCVSSYISISLYIMLLGLFALPFNRQTRRVTAATVHFDLCTSTGYRVGRKGAGAASLQGIAIGGEDGAGNTGSTAESS